MGDRCYLTIYIHGHIETVDQLGKTIAALELDGLVPEYGPDNRGYCQQFLFAVENTCAASFVDDQCNYAEINDTEEALQALAVPYSVTHDEGGDYGAGCWAWSPAAGKTEALRDKENGAYITTSILTKALEKDNAIEVIKALIRECDTAEGKGLPSLSVSDAVLSHLKTKGQ